MYCRRYNPAERQDDRGDNDCGSEFPIANSAFPQIPRQGVDQDGTRRGKYQDANDRIHDPVQQAAETHGNSAYGMGRRTMRTAFQWIQL
jgi:hypothetical protein